MDTDHTQPNLSSQASLNQGLSQVYPHHLTEWLDSSVDKELINLNLTSLEGFVTYDYLLYGLPGKERRNDGRLRDKWLLRYAPLSDGGGWWVSGLDPLNNWQPMLWGRFKPDTPRIIGSKNKPIKYESPPHVSNRVTYFDIPPHIWDKVAKRYGIKRYYSSLAMRLADKPLWRGGTVGVTSLPKTQDDSYCLAKDGQKQSLLECLQVGFKPSTLRQDSSDNNRPIPICFWEWVQKHPEIPIILTEGEKKAACLLSMGFAAIALPGIWMGRVGKKNVNERLHPDLMPLAQSGRKFTILFDYETKPKTRYAVYQATLRTGKAIEAAGCECDVAILPGPEKGVDDFVMARGEDSEALLTTIIEDALSLQDYRQVCFPRKRGLSKKYPPNIRLNTRYLSDALHLQSADRQPTTGTIVLDSGMGTGKTELMARFRQLFPQMRFLNLGHRVNLLKNLSERLGTEMYSALSQRDLATAVELSMTVDSLYKLQHQLQQYDCVFIDEACQYLAHLLHSKTCKDHRAEILEVLEYIIRTAKLVILADAHMDDVTVDFFRAMRPEGEVPFIVKNDYKQRGRTVYFYEGEDSSVLVAKIFMALMLKQKIMVVSDSKKFIKKLEAAMTVRVFDNQPLFGKDEQLDSESDNKLRVWSIHAENSGSEENVAFIKDISESVKNVDALLASPSLGTGVDISNDHFDEVFGVFHAVSQTATECAQSLHRNRRQVPLHIWVAPRPPFGYKETNATKIKERMLNLNEMTAFLIRIDPETGKRGAEKDWALDAYCEIEANRNRSINNLRDDLRSLLTEMAYNIVPVKSEKDESVAQELKDAAMGLDAAHTHAVVQANDITPSEYLARQAQDYLQPEELIECEKYRISRDYGMAVTEDLVKRDDGGHLISKLIALEATIAPSEGEIVDPKTAKKYPAPPQIVAQRDLRERDNLPLCMDWHNYSGKWLARHILGVPKILARLLAGEELCAADPDLIKMTEAAKKSRAHIKAILGFTIPVNCRPMWLLGSLLDQLGLKMVAHKKGKQGQQVRYYSLVVENLTFAIEVLEHRERERQKKAERERQIQEENRLYQARMQTQYGINRQKDKIATPPLKRDVYPLEGSVDMVNNQTDNPNSKAFNQQTFKNLTPFYELCQKTIYQVFIKEIFSSIKTLKIVINCRLLRFS